ncbi:dTDP-4-dehydrorhamnose 3,5-epimerase [Ferrimonas gelatinilytica]|uniref:dTDP-4-dehydrorhamnose 3,5-epimerase n=1 Tax=Ferrimonas gelatinilytica TaxID=1255257 RepID=A0ABP9RU24_9GAMM
MKVINTELSDCYIIEPKVFGDSRGFFFESFQLERFKKSGIDFDFVQDNRSRSSKGVIRGLHFQKNKPQGKLVSVTRGEVLDVAVDLRENSPTFGKSLAVILNDVNNRQLWIPPGFAHGFSVLSEFADFHYKCTEYYDPQDEGGIIWNDEHLNIDWKVDSPLISDKDKLLPSFKEIFDNI